MTTIYVVTASRGEYSDRNTYVAAAFVEQATAEAFVKQASDLARVAFANWGGAVEEYWNPEQQTDEWRAFKAARDAVLVVDPKWKSNYAGTTYEAESVPLKSG